MKAVSLAGGYGTRISQESNVSPKPMVEIGGKPILWHVMKLYSAHAINEFIVCCGSKASIIKQYFANYFLNSADVTLDLRTNSMEVHQAVAEPSILIHIRESIDSASTIPTTSLRTARSLTPQHSCRAASPRGASCDTLCPRTPC